MPVPWRRRTTAGSDEKGGVAFVQESTGSAAAITTQIDIAPPCFVEDPSNRAISLRQLRSLRDYVRRLCKAGILRRDLSRQDGTQQETEDDRIFWFSINQYDINELVLKKIIPQDKSCSWVELVADPDCPEQAPDTYLSHAWAESFRDFMLSIEHHAKEKRAGPDHTYWFCVCANNQWDVSSDLDTTLATSPFFRALQKAQSTLLLLDRQGIVTKRAWCLFEWYQTVIGLGRPEALEVVTGMGMVGSSTVSSGRYVDLLKSLCSKNAEASDPRDLRRIQNSIAGEQDETRDLDMIIRIQDSTKEGRVLMAPNGLRVLETEVYEYQRGFGEKLCSRPCGTAILQGTKFHVKESIENERELELFEVQFGDDDGAILKAPGSPVLVQCGAGTNLVNISYAIKHRIWLESNEKHFDQLDEQVKGRALSVCRDSFQTKHNRGMDLSNPTFRAMTLSEFRRFAAEVKRRFADEDWNSELFDKKNEANRMALGHNGPGDYYGVNKFDWAGSWETLTWFHIKHLMILEDVSNADCSYVETLPGKKAMRGQFHFTFGWEIPFSAFVDAMEWLAEARELSDTTPMFIYPLTMNIKSRREYYDGKVWEACMKVCDSAALYFSEVYNAGPLLDIHNAVAQHKSIDFICATGVVALIRPFEAGRRWEIGRFNVGAARVCIVMDAGDAASHSPAFLSRLKSIGPVGIAQLNKKIRSAGAGPVLREAAYHDDTETVELVFRKCPWLITTSTSTSTSTSHTANSSILVDERLRGPLGESPLHVASSSGSRKVLQLLLAKNANVNVIDSDGETPLHYAALAGQEESARILLEANADAQQESFFSETDRKSVV